MTVETEHIPEITKLITELNRQERGMLVDQLDLLLGLNNRNNVPQLYAYLERVRNELKNPKPKFTEDGNKQGDL